MKMIEKARLDVILKVKSYLVLCIDICANFVLVLQTVCLRRVFQDDKLIPIYTLVDCFFLLYPRGTNFFWTLFLLRNKIYLKIKTFPDVFRPLKYWNVCFSFKLLKFIFKSAILMLSKWIKSEYPFIFGTLS